MATEIIAKELYGGEVKINFYPNSHRYKLEGSKTYLVGVTTALGMIAKPQLIGWAARMATEYIQEAHEDGRSMTEELFEAAKNAHRRKKEEAGASGSLVHEWAENYIKTGADELPEDGNVLNGVLAFLKWVKAHKVKFTSSERIVYSRKHGYVGTLDAEAEIDGKLCVIDFKTSSGIYPEMHLQTAAYQKAAEEEGSEYTGHRWIVRFDKTTGEFEAVQAKEIRGAFKAFKAALALKQWSKARS
jgi:hypothetical protein